MNSAETKMSLVVWLLRGMGALFILAGLAHWLIIFGLMQETTPLALTIYFHSLAVLSPMAGWGLIRRRAWGRSLALLIVTTQFPAHLYMIHLDINHAWTSGMPPWQRVIDLALCAACLIGLFNRSIRAAFDRSPQFHLRRRSLAARPTYTNVAGGLMSHPKAVIATLVGLATAAALLAARLPVDAGIDTMFDKGAPLRRILDRVNDTFVNDDILLIGYQTDDVFSSESLRTTRWLDEQLGQITVEGLGDKRVHATSDVNSLTSVDDLVGTGDTFETAPLVPAAIPTDASKLAHIRERARNNPIVSENLLALKHPGVAAIVVRLAPDLSDAQQSETVTAVRDLLSSARSRNPHTRYHLYGEVVLEADGAAYQLRDTATFLPVTYLVIVLLLYLFVGRVRGVVVGLLAVTGCLLAAFAQLVVVGSSLNAVSVIMPPVMIALAMAMFVHFASAMGGSGDSGGANDTTKRFARVLPAVALAAMTTALGFGSLGFSEIPAIRGFGWAAGLAMLSALAICTLVVAFAWHRWPSLALVSGRSMASSPALRERLGALGGWIERYRWPIVAAGLALSVLATLGATRLRVNMDELAFYDESTPVRRANAFLERHFGGSAVVVVAVKGPNAEHFTEPSALDRVERLVHFMRDEAGLIGVTSAVDYVKLMHREYLGGDPDHYRIPDTDRQVAQLLLLNGDDTLGEFLDPSRQWIRLVGRTDLHGSAARQRMFQRLDASLGALFPAQRGYVTHATGQSRLWAAMVQQLTRGQIISICLSFAAIFALMFLVFRSLRLGLLSIPVNAFPVLLNLGLMGWIGIPLDPATVMISTVALGIAVDDTIHLLHHYTTRLKTHGDVSRAVAEALRSKGPAVVGTSVILASGFGVLLLSSFPPSRTFGLLFCGVLGAALIGDLLVLPALLLMQRGLPRRRAEKSTADLRVTEEAL